MTRLQKFIRRVYGPNIEEFPEHGYEVHSGKNWAKIVITDEAKWRKYQSWNFERIKQSYTEK